MRLAPTRSLGASLRRMQFDKTQFSLLITVVVLSATIPTAIAQRFFQPHPELGRHRHRPVEEVWPDSEVAP
jgi:hypothetical protein